MPVGISTSLDKIFKVAISTQNETREVQFKLGKDENGSDAQVSFDGGKTWISGDSAYYAIKAFEDRFPTAFGDE